jgi:dTMP kinase
MGISVSICLHIQYLFVIILFFFIHSEKAKALINSGYNVIMDRYAYSGIAYSMAKAHKKITFQWAINSDKGLLKPDVVIYLSLPIEEIAKRSNFGKEVFETENFQARVEEIYETLAEDRWEVVYVKNMSINEVHTRVRDIITKLNISSSKNVDDFAYLW